MKIIFQGREVETSAATLAEFLKSQGVEFKCVIVELDGALFSTEASLSAPLREGAELNMFRIVSGG